MLPILDKYNCQRDNCCILNRKNAKYSVFGKAKGRNTNYRLVNKSKYQINQFTVDDCVLAALEESKKCDYLFTVEKGIGVADAYFVEMKGKDLLHACKQIMNSINELGNNFKGEIFARIVTTGISTPNYKQDKNYRDLKGTLKEKFMHKNNSFEDTV